MKRLLLTAAMFPIYTSLLMGEPDILIAPIAPLINEYELFVQALVTIESAGNPFAIGKDDDTGLFQITPIRLADYNQRTGNNYTMDDMFDPEISRTIFDYYSKDLSFEIAARRWNGGPNGENKTSTEEYWNKIKNLM